MKKKIFIPICIVLVAIVAFIAYAVFSNNDSTLVEEYSEQIATAKSLSMDDMLSQCIYENYSTLQSSPDDFLGNYVDVMLQVTQDMGDGVYLGVESDNSENLWAISDHRETGGSFTVGGTAEICGIFAGNIDVTLEDSRTLSTPAVIAIYSEMDESVLDVMNQIDSVSEPINTSQINQITTIGNAISSLTDTQKSKVRNIDRYNEMLDSIDRISETRPYVAAIAAAKNLYNTIYTTDGFDIARIVYGTYDDSDSSYELVYISYNCKNTLGATTRKESITDYDTQGYGKVYTRDDGGFENDMCYVADYSLLNADYMNRQEINVDFVNYYMSKN